LEAAFEPVSQPFGFDLSELGCLPVSAMIHVPHAQDVFEEDGGYSGGVDGVRWNGYFDRTLDQLSWWARAAARERNNGCGQPAAFVTSPAERNAP
jgi:chromate reductase